MSLMTQADFAKHAGENMSFDTEFINNLNNPCCPYCGSEMHQNHSKNWTGKSYKFLAIEFCCYSEKNGKHNIQIRARNMAEWNEHLKRLKFVV